MFVRAHRIKLAVYIHAIPASTLTTPKAGERVIIGRLNLRYNYQRQSSDLHKAERLSTLIVCGQKLDFTIQDQMIWS